MNFNYTLSIFYVTLCMFPELIYWKVIVIEKKRDKYNFDFEILFQAL